MNDDIIRMAREACDTDKVDAWHNGFWTLTQEELERFAALVEKRAVSNIDPASWMSYQEGYAAGVAAERERIVAANAPEIERINAHIKTLEEAVAAEREACAEILDRNADACASNSMLRDVLMGNALAIRARGKHGQA